GPAEHRAGKAVPQLRAAGRGAGGLRRTDAVRPGQHHDRAARRHRRDGALRGRLRHAGPLRCRDDRRQPAGLDRRLEQPDQPMIGRTRAPWLLLLPAIALLVIGFVTPVAGMLVMSVQSPAGGFGLDNFARLLGSAYHLGAAWRSLRLGLIQTVLTVAL